MSGPKRARVYRTPVGRVAAARAEVERAMAACGSSQGNGLQDVIAETEKWLSSLRRETAGWRNPSNAQTPSPPSATTVQKLERMREDLSLSVAGEQRTCESLAQAQIAARWAVESAQRALRDSSSTAAHLAAVEAELVRVMSGVDRARRLADQSKRRIERQRAEFEAFYSHAVSKQSASKSGKRQDGADEPSGVADAAASAAARTKLSQQLAEISRPPQSGWGDIEKWAGGEQPVKELQGLLRSAEQLLTEGDVAATEAMLGRATLCREEIERAADANRRASERLRSVADAVMQALCDRHYDTPVFGDIHEGDPLSGIQIRADVPSADGRGNIRIELHADGRADFEVENVATGEEEMCRAVIGGIAEAVASEGMELEVTDWGRAGAETAKEEQHARKPEQVRKRMRGGSDARPDSHGGQA